MSFNEFHFQPQIVEAIRKCGFKEPTPIQRESFAPVLAGRDLLGLAQTGTGKTAAFMLPTVQHLLKSKGKHVKVLIIAPTRELAEQIHEFALTVIAGTRLRSVAVYGGVSKNVQISRIRKGVDIVVACPGRLLDIMNDGAIGLDRIEHLILDEADHMFDQGFLPDIRRILKVLPVRRQSLVFSATMPKEIRKLAEDVLQDPVSVQIDRVKPAKSVEHTLFEIGQRQKTKLLVHLLEEKEVQTTLVFTRTKYKARNLAVQLGKRGYKAVALQGNMSQSRRQEALGGFKDGIYNILVATDIAARGIDVSGISHVINYDMPDTAEAYIHRTGRTGRAANTGKAYTFATREDSRILKVIERSLGNSLRRGIVSLPQDEKKQSGNTRSGAGRNRTPEGSVSKNGRPAGKSRRNRSASSGVFGFVARGRR
jgi:superfamily II DNA/RNA helicase